MVRYSDPEDHPELGPEERQRLSPAQRAAKARERNASLTGLQAVEAARETALRQLDTRARSRHELERTLSQRGFADDVSQDVLDRLEAVGLINDIEFAHTLVRERFRGTGKVGRALMEDLRRTGLDQGIINDALMQVDSDDERKRATEMVRRKLSRMSNVSRDTLYRRLSSMLARKGYSPGICTQVVGEALSEWSEQQRNGEEDHEW